jgi:hypothetical protein
MTKRIVAGLGAIIVFGSAFAVEVAANPRNGGAVAAPNHTVRTHRHHRYYPYVPYYYYGYGSGSDYVIDVPPPAPPAAKPVAAKPEAETRRGCDSQTYSVPAASGGESQVTVLRC